MMLTPDLWRWRLYSRYDMLPSGNCIHFVRDYSDRKVVKHLAIQDKGGKFATFLSIHENVNALKRIWSFPGTSTKRTVPSLILFQISSVIIAAPVCYCAAATDGRTAFRPGSAEITPVTKACDTAGSIEAS
jgi:hypothetical protein